MSFNEMTEKQLVFKTNNSSIANSIVFENWLTNELITRLYSNDIEEQFNALQTIEDILIETENQDLEWFPHIDMIITSGIIHRLVEFLGQTQSPHIQNHCTNILYSIAWGCYTMDFLDDSLEKQAVRDARTIPVLVSLLESDNKSVFPRTHPMFQIITRRIVWTLLVLYRRDNSAQDFKIKSVCYPIITNLLFRTDILGLEYACNALYIFVIVFKESLQKDINREVCNRLVVLLKHTNNDVVISALLALCPILCDNTEQKQFIIDCNALPILHQFLSHNNRRIRMQSYCVISHITSGTKQQIQSVIDQNMIPDIVKCITTDVNISKYWALFAICHIIMYGSVHQIKYVLEQGCIALICDRTDNKTFLKCIENISKSGEVLFRSAINEYTIQITRYFGVDRIKNLMTNEDKEIQQMASHIFKRYFSANYRQKISIGLDSIKYRIQSFCNFL